VWFYFDETEHTPHDGTAHRFRDMIVGGCMAPQEGWEHLIGGWKATLGRYGVAHFHAKEFYTFNREFDWRKGGKRDVARHDRFQNRLASLNLDNVSGMVGNCVAGGPVKKPVQDAYRRAVKHGVTTILREAHDGPVNIVLARRHDVSPWPLLEQCRNLDWDKRLAGCGVFRPEDCIPLQAADFVLHAMLSRWREQPNAAFLRLRDEARARSIPFVLNMPAPFVALR
jgi:hypothetical protein